MSSGSARGRGDSRRGRGCVTVRVKPGEETPHGLRLVALSWPLPVVVDLQSKAPGKLNHLTIVINRLASVIACCGHDLKPNSRTRAHEADQVDACGCHPARMVSVCPHDVWGSPLQ